jgi:hypothetical protein
MKSLQVQSNFEGNQGIMGSMIPQENQLVNLQPKPPLKQLDGVKICQICGDDDVGVTLEASKFLMVCNERF